MISNTRVERDNPIAAAGELNDLCESFTSEFEHSTLDLDTFMGRYYTDHHTPLGNAFTAWAVMDEVVNWLDPKPVTCRPGVGI